MLFKDAVKVMSVAMIRDDQVNMVVVLFTVWGFKCCKGFEIATVRHTRLRS